MSQTQVYSLSNVVDKVNNGFKKQYEDSGSVVWKGFCVTARLGSNAMLAPATLAETIFFSALTFVTFIFGGEFEKTSAPYKWAKEHTIEAWRGFKNAVKGTVGYGEVKGAKPSTPDKVTDPVGKIFDFVKDKGSAAWQSKYIRYAAITVAGVVALYYIANPVKSAGCWTSAKVADLGSWIFGGIASIGSGVVNKGVDLREGLKDILRPHMPEIVKNAYYYAMWTPNKLVDLGYAATGAAGTIYTTASGYFPEICNRTVTV